MRSKLITAVALLLALSGGTSQAATVIKPAPIVPKTIPVVPLLPEILPHLSQGDDIAQALTTTQSAYLIGTLESSSSTLVNAATLGGSSDGYVSSFGWDGSPAWAVRLGGAGDDIATAGTVDTLGNIWVVGASNIPVATPTPYATPTNIFNPNHVSIAPTTPATTGLRRLLVWEISAASGAVIANYGYDFANVIEPTTIVVKASKLTIAGLSNDPAGPNFSIVMSATGTFSKPKYLVAKTTAIPAVTIIKSANYLWQSYVTSRAIPGIPSFKPKTPTTVLIKSSAKNGKIADLYTLGGSLVSLTYQKGSGLLLVTQGPTDYGISLIKTP